MKSGTWTTSIRRRIGGRLTIPTPGEKCKSMADGRGRQVETPERFTSLIAGGSSIACACEFIRCLWGGTLSGEKCKTLADGRGRQVEIPEKLTSLIADSSSIACACELIRCLWGGALSRPLCACSRVEGTGLGTHSELNHRNIETYKRLKTTRTLHGKYLNLQKIFKISLSLSLQSPG